MLVVLTGVQAARDTAAQPATSSTIVEDDIHDDDILEDDIIILFRSQFASHFSVNYKQSFFSSAFSARNIMAKKV